MNITPFQIYLWQQADTVCTLLSLVAFISLLASIFGSVVGGMLYDEKVISSKTLSIGLIVIWLFTSAAGVSRAFMPSSKTIALMYVLPEIANSSVIQKDVPEMYEMAKKALKETIQPEKE